MIIFRLAFSIITFVLAALWWLIVKLIYVLILLVDSHSEPIDPGHPAVR